MGRSSRLIIIFVCMLIVGASWLVVRGQIPRVSGLLPQEAYVWQRAWNEATLHGVRDAASDFSKLLALHAEISWRKNKPVVTRIPVDFKALVAAGRPIGLILRIGPFAGPFAADDAIARRLIGTAREMLADASADGVQPAEFQLDFDCAEARLDDYRVWVRALRAAVAPVPLTITALPCWLDRAAFADLIAETDGYVLQVHALRRPKGADDPVTLCDPAAARGAVERAAQIGRPFRVALPTYRYECAFDATGKLLGLRAESAPVTWPDGVRLRQLSADPQAMATLVSDWTRDRPAALQGIIWFRLPVANDEMNWSRATLVSVMKGRPPAAPVRAFAASPEPGLTEIELANEGDADGSGPRTLVVRAAGRRIVAADGLSGYEWRAADDGNVAFDYPAAKQPPELRPGRHRKIGWIRWDADTEVQVDVEAHP